jgi:uncharacterized damage-inducible protein DinB
MKELHILNQLRFARSEFQKGFKGVSEEESRRRFMPINSIAWIVGHLAWHEQNFWLKRAQGIIPYPRLDEVTASGKPPVDVSLKEMADLWLAVIKASEDYLTKLSKDELMENLVINGKELPANIGTMMTRVTYHYFYHIGEMQAIRQLLGHQELPSYIGNGIETVGQFYWDD